MNTFGNAFGPNAIFGDGDGDVADGTVITTWHKPKPPRIRPGKIKPRPRDVSPLETYEPERIEFDPVNDDYLRAMQEQWQAMQPAPTQPAGPSDMDMQMAAAHLRMNAQQRAHEDKTRRQQDDEDAILALLLH